MRIDRPIGNKSQLTGSFSGSFYGVGDLDTLNVDGNTTIGGSLVVTGRISAIEYHNTIVSSSIIYSQGSTKFGNSSDDVHSFTGSVRVQGSLTGSIDWSNVQNVTLPSTQLFVGNSSGIAQARALSSDATLSNTGALTISNNVVTDAKLRQSAGFSVIGKTATGTGNVADITAGDNGVLRRSGAGNLEFGTIVTANIADSNVTEGKLATDSVSTNKIVNLNVTTGKIADLNVTTGKIADLNVTEGKLATDSVSTNKIVNLNVTTAKIADLNVTEGKLAADAVTNAKLANMAINTIKGRISTGTGDPEDLTAANVRTIINVADGANNYVHPTGFVNQPTSALSGANVISQIVVSTEGHVATVNTRTMTLAELGYTGATDANNYVHPTGFSSQPASALTGATVISQVTVNSNGHTTGVSTRDLTLGNLGYSTPALQAVTDAGATTTNSITAANFITTSDRRVKSKITNIVNPFETLDKIKSYEYIKDGNKEAGFIAQEVQEAIPYAVFEGENGMLTMSDRPILAYLFAAVMELKEENKQLKERLGVINNKL
jgi:hypothetical protein